MRKENEIPVEEQRLDAEQRKLLQTVYDRLLIWKDGCSEIHTRAANARKTLLLQDPEQDPPGTQNKTLQLQTLVSTFNNCVADQMDNVMEAVMTPETPELQEMVDDINDIVKYIYDRNEYLAYHRMRVQDYLCTGTHVCEISWDEDASDGKGDISIDRVPIENFLWDPAEDDIQNGRANMKVSWHPLSWYREHFPENGKYVTASEENTNLAVGEKTNQERIAADEEKAMLIEYWWREYDASKKKYKINLARVAGGALLETFKDVYAHGLYPFVLDVHTEIEGLPVGEGLVMQLAPMMRYINRYAKYMDANIRASAKQKYMVNRSANLDMDALTNWDDEVVVGDKIDDASLRAFPVPQLSGYALNQMVQMQTDLKQDSGQNQFARGETAGGVTAASAIASLQEAGGKQTRMRTETLKRGFKRITEQILWLISQHYDEGRIMMITGKDNVTREVDVSPSRIMGKKRGEGILPPPPYTVRVNVQRMNPATVAAQNQLFIDIYKMSAEAGNYFPLSALIRMLQVDGKEKILPIVVAVEQQTAMMQQIAQENEQLKQAVEQQQRSIDGMKQLIQQQVIQSQSTSQQANAAGQGMGMNQAEPVVV